MQRIHETLTDRQEDLIRVMEKRGDDPDELAKRRSARQRHVNMVRCDEHADDEQSQR